MLNGIGVSGEKREWIFAGLMGIGFLWLLSSLLRKLLMKMCREKINFSTITLVISSNKTWFIT